MGKIIREIAEWHEQTFKEESLNGQSGKLLEELIEFFDEDDPEKAVTELADCFIVACGIWRFSKVDALPAFINIENIMHNRGISYEELTNAINKKMEINRSRNWEKNGEGSYQHK